MVAVLVHLTIMTFLYPNHGPL